MSSTIIKTTFNILFFPHLFFLTISHPSIFLCYIRYLAGRLHPIYKLLNKYFGITVLAFGEPLIIKVLIFIPPPKKIDLWVLLFHICYKTDKMFYKYSPHRFSYHLWMQNHLDNKALFLGTSHILVCA